MDDQIEYLGRVDDWVAALVTRQIEWSVLLDSLPSVYPMIVRDSAVRLRISDQIRHSEHLLITRSTRSRARELWQQHKLPTPHALDGCWWFADAAVRGLADWVRQLSSAGDLVALLGAPTLFHYLREETTDRELVLVDRSLTDSDADAGAGWRLQADLLRLQPKLSRPASVIVVDPPWYGPEMRAFLSTARSNSTRGTKILLSTAPIGTRPGIQSEWTDLIRWCDGIGLRLIECLPLALRYISPPFETNALRVAGVPSCPPDWRRGDLAVFECLEDPTDPRPMAAPIVRESWHDVDIGRVRLKIKGNPSAEWASPILQEIVRDDVLPSVSRRDERLDDVALWTSGNRVFGASGLNVLRRIVEALAVDRCPAVMLKSEMGTTLGKKEVNEIELTADRLRRIVEIEELELDRWNRSLNNASLVNLAS